MGLQTAVAGCRRESRGDSGDPGRARGGYRQSGSCSSADTMEAQAENGGTKRRNEPLSLEEIKKRKLEQEKQLSKPTFMTKEQREAAALARRAAQVEAMRAQQGSDRRVAQMATGMKTEEEEKKEADRARDRDRDRRDDRDRDRDRGGRDRDRRDDRDRDRSRDDRDRRDRDRRDRSRSRERRDRDRRDRDRDRDRGRDREEERRKEEERKKQQEEERKAAQMRAQMEKEVAAIKAQYMGMQKNQKKFIKPSEKFKLARMDTWDASDDTTKEAAPLQGAGTFRPLFGRGYVGGVDRNDQSKWLGVNNGGGSPAPRANVVPDGAEIVAGPGAPRERPLTREEIVRRLEEEAEERDDVPAREKTEEEKLEEEMAAAAAGAEGGEEGQAAAAAPAAAEVGAALKDRSTAGIVGGRLKQEKHWSEKKLEEMTERDWRIMREDHEISCRGNRIANPIRNWEEAQLQPSLHEAITVKAKYDKPTPIQMQAIPIGLSRRDIIGVAETGSGKTAAFVIPMLMYIKTVCPPMTQENAAEGPYAVVMAPTRELAQQIEEEARKFAEAVGLRVYSIVGGINIEQQGFDMRDGVEIIIATPGRMADCIEKRYIVLNQCNYVVLDEADRMLELGFEPALNYVLDAMPASNLRPENEEEMDESLKIYRQTFMFSATMPASVERLAKKYLRNPITIQVGTPGQAVDRIKQVVMVVTEAQKKDRLVELVRRAEPPIMIFVGSKKMADFVARGVNHEAGKRAAAIHSGKMQDQREEALNSFRERRVDVLVATDVAGRGIDIKGVKHVINYDMPSSIETYTHRIGRTGRAGATGTATSLLTLNDTDIMYDLKQTLLATKNAVPKELNDCPEANTKPGTVSDKPRRQQGPKFAI